ncbi:hypothetical protein FGIG_01404 [Fasciola gigantica]|uniref:Uncharacterized protein n=1 Tax=Fasciola gigantica TaxID=46835 RepID=A0A504YI77_FASGI|nr:hypothetical protein FGIG_01404 [Fasciola gigantica]
MSSWRHWVVNLLAAAAEEQDVNVPHTKQYDEPSTSTSRNTLVKVLVTGGGQSTSTSEGIQDVETNVTRQTSKTVGGRKYVHLGLEEGFQRAPDADIMHDSGIYIQLHIDGLTLFRGSSQQLWPILKRVSKPPSLVFLTGL